MDIVVSINAEYIDKAKSMLFSMHNYIEEKVIVWLLNHSLSVSHIEAFHSFLTEQCSMEFMIIEVKDSFFDSMPLVSTELFSIETYYRILIPWLLPQRVKRALWLDSDMIITGDISKLYYTDFENKCIVACEDERQLDPETRARDKNRLMLSKEHRYFNAGVLLMNNELIRQKYTVEGILALSQTLKDKIIYADQDILNYLYQNYTLYEDYHIYNCNAHLFEVMSDKEAQSVRIIHYYGPLKPWKIWTGFDPRMKYWDVQRQRGRVVFWPCLILKIRHRLGKIRWMRRIYHCMIGVEKTFLSS
ncbi:MAG: glycosyltransferase family 8 protein [Eubacterium sp.]|nr:glycosyltransferase family 8 protein [Eubacterium sp.]